MLAHDMSSQARYRALYRETCRKVLEILRRGPLSVAEIHAQLPGYQTSRVSVSQALDLLVKAQFAGVRREGRNRIYRLRPDTLQELARYFTRLARDARQNR